MKNATVWTQTGETLPTNEGANLLLETGFSLLLETGHKLLLEDNVYTPKSTGAWAKETKNSTVWGVNGRGEPSLTNLGVERTTEAGVVRTTESGLTRTLEDLVMILPSKTSWSENND